MLRHVNQSGQGALSFPEKKPETSIFLGKKEQAILNLVFDEAIICYSSTEHKPRLYSTRLRIRELKTSAPGM